MFEIMERGRWAGIILMKVRFRLPSHARTIYHVEGQ